jgi:hypothetical protein
MINASLTVDQAKQFMAITEGNHMDWEPFVVLQEQIGKQLAEHFAVVAEIVAEEAVAEAEEDEAPVEEAEPVDAAAEAAFLDGVPHEQFTHEDDKVE